MFYLRKALRNSIIHRNKSIVTCVLCFLILMLFQLYMAVISSNQKQLSLLARVTPVQAVVLNLQGNQETNLVIKDSVVQKLQQIPYLYDELFTARTIAGVGRITSNVPQQNLNLSVLAVNTISAVPELNEKEITWVNGYQSKFFQQEGNKCVVVKSVMDQNNWKLGDTITLTQYYFKYVGYEETLRPLGTTNFEIVGSLQLPESKGASFDVLLPLKTERSIYLKNNVPFFADSASFYIDPLRINDFVKEMRSMYFMRVADTAEFSHDGIALSVNDSNFIISASQLRQNMDTLEGFLPFILVIMIGIGYIASFLLLQSRKKEIAIMRSVGVSRKACFAIIVMEQLIVALIGVTAGSILAAVWLSASAWMIFESMAIVLSCYIAGTCVAMWRTGRVNVMEALTRVD